MTFRWSKCKLNYGCMQFDPKMYRQTSSVFIRSSLASDLANGFDFRPGFECLLHMVNEYEQYGPSRYLFHSIHQFAVSTKR